MRLRMCPVTSPLFSRIGAWRARLRNHPDQDLARYVLRGLEQGFRIGFDHRSKLSPAKYNMPSAREHPEVVDQYIREERSAGRILCPFAQGEIPGFHINHIGVIPKGRTSRKWRVITDMSFPDNNSVNDGISKVDCTLVYTSVERVARAAHMLDPGALLAKKPSVYRPYVYVIFVQYSKRCPKNIGDRSKIERLVALWRQQWRREHTLKTHGESYHRTVA